MKVAVYYSNDDVRIEERPVPGIGEGELLVKVMASGICGSDVMEWYRKKKAPLVPGHELSGEVVEVGRGAVFSRGDRVAVLHKVPCDACSHCLKGHHSSCDTARSTNIDPGGFSEYIRVPAINAEKGTFVIPGRLSYEEAAFLEPLGCAVRAQRIAGISKGDSVLVMGSGIAGLLHIRLCLARGAGRVFATDISDYRLRMARGSGAVPLKASANVPELLRESIGGLADKVIVCTGARGALLQAFESVERGGSIMLFAVPRPGEDVPIPFNDIWTNEIRMLTSYYTSPGDIREALGLLASGKVEVPDLITHRLPLERIGEGFRLVADAGESCKVMLMPHGAARA
jgi:L-iditol 2-dehydrogenase